MLDLLASLHSSLHSQRTRISYQNNSRCTRADGNWLSRRLRASLLPILVALFAAAVLCTNAGAQVRFGSVVGSVADASGATVSGATIKLTNLGTNETRTMQSSSAGTYSFPNLIAGMYRVEVQTQGFKQFIQDNVEVQVDVATRVDAKLQVGNVTESVLVTTEAPPLQTDSASLGTTISQTEVESIPLSGRNVNNMLTLVPGVVAQGGTYGNAVSNQAGGARTNAIGFGNYAIGGGFGNQSSFYIDGVASNAPAGNLNSLIPTQDMVQEFRVVTNNVGAEYGSYAGGIINLTTKSGTNKFHGTAYEYLRNKVLNANDYFSNQAGLARVPLIQNQLVESTLNTTLVWTIVFPTKTPCLPGTRIGRQIATPMMRGGPTHRVRAILVSTLIPQYLETLTPSILRRFWICGSPICVSSNTSSRTAKALTSLNSVPVGQALQASLWRQRIFRQ